jgi:RHS repeat-associated protein
MCLLKKFKNKKVAVNLYIRCAFGSSKNLRQFNLATTRVGFNSKENDNEVKGNGNSLDFGARIYDSRLGRWWGIDQMTGKHPGFSPYNFVQNNPMVAIDPDGRDIFVVIQNAKTGKAEVVKADMNYIIQTLNSTKAGHELLADFSDNPNKDIYITIGKTHAEGVLGQHSTGTIFTDGKDGKVTISTPSKLNDKGVSIYDFNGEKSRDQNFEGVEIYNPQKENHFVTLSEDVFNGGELGLKQAGARLGAKVLGHEVGAHAQAPPLLDEDSQHAIWGQAEISITKIQGKNIDFTTYSNGSGKAEELNTQIDKVKVTKKDGIKTTPISNAGNAKAVKISIEKK